MIVTQQTVFNTLIEGNICQIVCTKTCLQMACLYIPSPCISVAEPFGEGALTERFL